MVRFRNTRLEPHSASTALRPRSVRCGPAALCLQAGGSRGRAGQRPRSGSEPARGRAGAEGLWGSSQAGRPPQPFASKQQHAPLTQTGPPGSPCPRAAAPARRHAPRPASRAALQRQGAVSRRAGVRSGAAAWRLGQECASGAGLHAFDGPAGHLSPGKGSSRSRATQSRPMDATLRGAGSAASTWSVLRAPAPLRIAPSSAALGPWQASLRPRPATPPLLGWVAFGRERQAGARGCPTARLAAERPPPTWR